MDSLDFLDQIILPIQYLQVRKQLPFICPVCSKAFKWDVQLLRHQRKTYHQNKQREQRRYRRGRKQNKKSEFVCQYCQQRYLKSVDLLNHRPWCLKDSQHGQRAKKYCSSWSQRQFQCKNHQFPHYFTNLHNLMKHISLHNKKVSPQTPLIQRDKRMRFLSSQLVNQLNKQFTKYTRLTLDQAQRIARSKSLSISTVRKYFRLFKQNKQS